jgi:uncharacterized membrane protein YbhN (UPF0104 family)
MNRRAVPAVLLDSTPERAEPAISKAGSRASNRTPWTWVRLGLGAGILVVLVWRVGADPFLDGLRLTSPWALSAAIAITALTTLCCAWRWSVVAKALGADVPVGAAVPAYYRSQFLNATLPGGVLGDVHRAVSHGRDIGSVGLALRSVVWERGLGQVVQVALSVLVLVALPSPMRPTAAVIAVIAAVGVGACLALALIRRAHRDLRRILRTPRAGLSIAVASVAAAAGHTLIFLIAAQTAGAQASLAVLLPVALVVLLASAVPTNIAGWGPREGAAAWAFGAAGLTAAEGVTTAVVYGVMALVSTLPGALVLVAGRRRVEVAAHG